MTSGSYWEIILQLEAGFSLAIYKPTTLLIKNSGALGDQLIRIYNPFEHLSWNDFAKIAVLMSQLL